MDNRKRVLELYKYLCEESDESHPVTIEMMVDYMNTISNKKIDHKTIRADLAFLADSGLDLVIYRGKKMNYYIGERSFQTSELKSLIDAVSSAQFITKDKTKLLQEKMLKSFSKHERESFSNQIDVINRIKQDNECIYYEIDAINQAIISNKNIEFKYISYDENKNEVYRHDGQTYELSPYALIWNNDRYYLVGYSILDNEIRNYRVDRMRQIKEIDSTYVKLNDSDYRCSNLFNMYSGPSKKITLLCKNDLMNHIVDKFGIDVDTKVNDNETFTATVDIQVSPTFYAWLFTFGGDVKILEPVNVLNDYRQFYERSRM